MSIVMLCFLKLISVFFIVRGGKYFYMKKILAFLCLASLTICGTANAENDTKKNWELQLEYLKGNISSERIAPYLFIAVLLLHVPQVIPIPEVWEFYATVKA